MAKKTGALPPASLPLDDPALPQVVRDRINAAYSTADRDYTSGSFAARHPILSNVVAAGLGGLFMGPMGLAAGPLANSSHESNRKASIAEAYNNVIKSTLENQKSIDTITQPRNDNILRQQKLDQLNKERAAQGLPPIPDLYQRDLPGLGGTPAKQHDIPNYSPEATKDYMNSAFGGSDINYKLALDNYLRQTNYAMPNNALGWQGAGTGNGSEQQPFRAGATMQDQGPELPIAPMFVNDPQTILQQSTTVGNNALEQGQKRFEFDQEAPKRDAEVEKLKKEAATQVQLAQKYMQEGKTEQARQALMKAQEAEARASASLKNRTNPNIRGGGSPNMLELMTPEQRKAYLDKHAGLGPSRPETLTEAFQQANLEDMANERDWFGNPSARARIAQQALTRFRGSEGGPNLQFQSPTTPGGGGRLSSGRVFNP